MKIVSLIGANDDPQNHISINGFRIPWPFPIASMLYSSEARVFGHRVYGGKKYWWVMPAFRFLRKIHDLKWGIEYRLYPAHYHHLDTGLKPGYHNPDKILLYGAMAALGRFVDECGGIEEVKSYAQEMSKELEEEESIQREANDFHIKVHEEVFDIWCWWTEQRPEDKKKLRELRSKAFGKGTVDFVESKDYPGNTQIIFPNRDNLEKLRQQYYNLEEKIRNDEQEMLHRLIDIRGGLWT